MKVVAVSQRVDAFPARDEVRDGLDQRLAAWLLAAGCLPVPVPNALGADPGAGALDAWLASIRPSAVVLSGGGDPQEPPERRRLEGSLLDHAAAMHLPVLGICRGLQFMALRAGAVLQPQAGHVRTRHRLSGEIDGEANSYHELGLAAVPAGYRLLARAEDGSIEALRHVDLPWEGWMWHPEREPGHLPRDLERMRQLLGAAQAR